MKKRTPQQNQRLRKLIKFLESLPRSKFNFGTVVDGVKSNGHQCATVGCAIGWLPSVFPKTVRWGTNETGGWDYMFRLHGRTVSFDDLAKKFLGCPVGLFLPDDNADYIPKHHACADDATPKKVAKMLHHYMETVK